MNNPVPPNMKVEAVIRPDRCEKCKFSSLSPNNPNLLDCHRHPPQVFVFPIESPENPGRVSMQHYTTVPQVHPANHCGEFRPRIET